MLFIIYIWLNCALSTIKISSTNYCNLFAFLIKSPAIPSFACARNPTKTENSWAFHSPSTTPLDSSMHSNIYFNTVLCSILLWLQVPSHALEHLWILIIVSNLIFSDSFNPKENLPFKILIPQLDKTSFFSPPDFSCKRGKYFVLILRLNLNERVRGVRQT